MGVPVISGEGVMMCETSLDVKIWMLSEFEPCCLVLGPPSKVPGAGEDSAIEVSEYTLELALDCRDGVKLVVPGRDVGFGGNTEVRVIEINGILSLV
jgi:hypothetical protein